MAEPTEWRNPLRNEADAFRVLVMILVAFALVVAAAEIVGTWLSLIVAATAMAIGLYAAVGWLRVGLEESDDEDGDSDSGAPR